MLGFAALLAAGSACGDRHCRAERYDQAAAEYRRELQRGNTSAAVHYNLGTALLRLQRYGEAREHLEIATRADEPGTRQRAFYNQGNTHLEPAFRAQRSPERTEALQEAVRSYREALLLDPDDMDAKWNLELAQRLLAEQGSGGSSDDPRQGGGGGGGEDEQAPSSPDPTPAPAGGTGSAPQMTPAEAERVLQAAAQREASLQQEKLQRSEVAPPNVRDW